MENRTKMGSKTREFDEKVKKRKKKEYRNINTFFNRLKESIIQLKNQ